MKGLARTSGKLLLFWWFHMAVKPSCLPLTLGLLTWALFLPGPGSLVSQTATVGSIIGHMRVLKGDSPPERILVNLEVRGASMDSVYTDSQGTFGFHNLPANEYYVTINDDHYQPLRQLAVIQSSLTAPTVFLELTLIPNRQGDSKATSPGPAGTNPNLVDVREFEKHYPKEAVKEFKKGLEADGKGKRDEAIAHYQKAVRIAPGFYFARNNLGTDQLSKSNFAAARAEFEQVLKLNQSDSAAYFNLGNACMQMGDLGSAQHYIEEGTRREPDSAVGHFLQGSLDLRFGRLPEAEAALRQAMQLSPTMTQARLQLVNLLLQQGRKEDAAAELRSFVAAFPDSSFSPQAKLLLKRLESSPAAN